MNVDVETPLGGGPHVCKPAQVCMCVQVCTCVHGHLMGGCRGRQALPGGRAWGQGQQKVPEEQMTGQAWVCAWG